MLPKFIRAAWAIALGTALFVGEAKAAFVGSFGFNGLGTSTNTGDLASATQLSNVAFNTNGNSTGGFTSITPSPLSPQAVLAPTSGSSITLSTTSPTGFSFTNATFGTFTQNTLAVLKSQSFSSSLPSFVTSVTYYIVGSYSGGPVGTSAPASVTITFTQNGGPGSSFSASGTLDIPPVSVPEPTSMALVGLGLAGVAAVARRRRQQG